MFFKIGYTGLSVVILIFRLLHVMPTLLCILRVFGPACTADKDYGSLLAKDIFQKFWMLYATIALVGFLEAPFLAYLPWNATEASRAYHGFPDLTTLRQALYTKLVQSSALIVCSILYLTKLKALGLGEHAGADGVVIVSVIFTIMCAVMAVLKLCTGQKSLASSDNIDKPSNEKSVNAVEMFDVRKTIVADVEMNDIIPLSSPHMDHHLPSAQSDTSSPVKTPRIAPKAPNVMNETSKNPLHAL